MKKRLVSVLLGNDHALQLVPERILENLRYALLALHTPHIPLDYWVTNITPRLWHALVMR